VYAVKQLKPTLQSSRRLEEMRREWLAISSARLDTVGPQLDDTEGGKERKERKRSVKKKKNMSFFFFLLIWMRAQAHLVHYYNFSVEKSWLFMEYCENGTLLNFIRGQPLLSSEMIGQFTTQILLGLNALHSKGFVHRLVGCTVGCIGCAVGLLAGLLACWLFCCHLSCPPINLLLLLLSPQRPQV
jgi:serine/threonine protein kinase